MAPDSVPGTRPTVLETLAVTGGTPKASRVGKVIRVPEPTMVLIVPAAMPASRMAATSNGVTSCAGRRRRGRGGRWRPCLVRLGMAAGHLAHRQVRRRGARVGGVLGLGDGGLDRLVGAGELSVRAGVDAIGGAVVGDPVAHALGLQGDAGDLVD